MASVREFKFTVNLVVAEHYKRSLSKGGVYSKSCYC